VVHARVIVRVWINFNERSIDHVELLSTVTRITEGSLQDYFDDLFGTGNSFHDFTRR
jgi:hypothetical protein